ncbi:unnamed protein product, partial [Vitis vinifera]|uniref:Uncharacterized protein n=1 Tax=Vitis vinifera TaxID=29760 RepID=D7SR44_VITVI
MVEWHFAFFFSSLRGWICTKAPLVQSKVLTKPSKSIPIPQNISFQSPYIYIYGVSTLRSEAEPNSGRLQNFSLAENGFVLCLGGGKKVRKEKKLMS